MTRLKYRRRRERIEVAHHGLFPWGGGLGYHDIAEVMSIPWWQVRQIEQEALAKLNRRLSVADLLP